MQTAVITWFDPKEKLPEIPADLYGVGVLCTVYDSYDESYTVMEYQYLKTESRSGNPLSKYYVNSELEADFMALYTSRRSGCYVGEQWGPVMEEVVAWAYLPPPFKRKE